MTRPGLKRSLMYIFSLAILALGITLNTKTQLGVSPIVSVPYCISQLTGLPLGLTTFAHYLLLILLQKLLLGKAFPPLQYLQILCSLVTSLFIQGWDMLLPVFQPMWARIPVLLAAIFITGLGANPADGLADTVGRKIRRNVGMGKNLIDLVSVVISLALGLLFARRILGIGLGTVAAVLLTGRVYALVHSHSLNLAKRLKSAERA